MAGPLPLFIGVNPTRPPLVQSLGIPIYIDCINISERCKLLAISPFHSSCFLGILLDGAIMKLKRVMKNKYI